MKKGKLRSIFVGGDKYRWIVDEKEVRIYDDMKNMYRIDKHNIFFICENDPYFLDITPRHIQVWIEKKIIKKNECNNI